MRAGRRSTTAQYAALVRAVLTHKGIVSDPHASHMLAPLMRASAAVLKRRDALTNSAFYAGLATRTLIFDGELVDALDAGITQVVVVGAGYDSRAWRFARAGVRFFELDHPATQADKQRRAPVGGPTFVPFDLAAAGSVADALEQSGVDWRQPVVFLIEGVTMYLDAEEVDALLRALADATAPGSRLVVNFAAPAGSGGPEGRRRQFVLALLGWVHGERFRSGRGMRDAGAFVEATGWVVGRALSLRDVAPVVLPLGTAVHYGGINPGACVVIASKPSP